MFIRQARTASKITGEAYFTFRLVRGKRIGGRVRQITVLNLGRNFAIKQEDWPVLCSRIEQRLEPQDSLLTIECSAHIERAAQRCFAQLVVRAPAVEQPAHPGSELATWDWLQTHSALGELLEVDFNAMSHMSLYRASDLLVRHRRAIEDHLFGAAQTLLGFEESVTLYDLTNTYFEGAMAGNAKAKRGRSKEKRSDCPLITLGLVLDGSGFVRRSKTFAGNVTEGTTLQGMLQGLEASPGAMIIMDASSSGRLVSASLRACGLAARTYQLHHVDTLIGAGHCSPRAPSRPSACSKRRI